MQTAIGLIETKGLVALVEATDAMAKAANVQIVKRVVDRRRLGHDRRLAATSAACGRRSKPAPAPPRKSANWSPATSFRARPKD